MKKIPTSFDIPHPLRERIAEVLQSAVAETFHVVFGMDIAAGEFSASPAAHKEDLICLVKLVQNDLEFKVHFGFCKDLLRQIVASFYPPEAMEGEEAFADAAAEIANIVGCNLKAFLNSQGYNLEMLIPYASSLDEAGLEDAYAINLFFTAQHQNFCVNVRMMEKEAVCA